MTIKKKGTIFKKNIDIGRLLILADSWAEQMDQVPVDIGMPQAVFLFRQFWGRNSAPFPMAKHHHFSQLTQKNSQSKIQKKSELESSFLIATKTNDYYIFTFVEVNTVSNCVV